MGRCQHPGPNSRPAPYEVERRAEGGGAKGGEGGEGAEGDVVPVPHVEFGHGTPRYQWKSHRSTYIALILRHTTVPRKCDINAGADFINQSLPQIDKIYVAR